MVPMPTFQYMSKQEETWTTVEAAACERDADVITLIDVQTEAGVVDHYSVDIYDVVRFPEEDAW
jgi:hypothetical protein